MQKIKLEDEALSTPPPFSGGFSNPKRCCIVYTVIHNTALPMIAVFEENKTAEAREYFDREIKKAILQNEFTKTIFDNNIFTGLDRNGFTLTIGICILEMNKIPRMM